MTASAFTTRWMHSHIRIRHRAGMFVAEGLTPTIWFSCSSVPPASRGAQMNIRYRVELRQTERDELKGFRSGGRHAARKLKRAQILLAADAGPGSLLQRGTSKFPTETIPRMPLWAQIAGP